MTTTVPRRPRNLGPAKIHPDLLPLAKPIAWFRPNPENTNDHPEDNLAAIAHSLEDYEQCAPVVALDDGTVIVGNGRLEAAKRMGWLGLAAIVFQDREKAEAYAVADNQTARLSLANSRLPEALKRIASRGVELGRIGFNAEALKAIGMTLRRGTAADLPGNAADGADTSPQLGGIEFRVVVDCVDEPDQTLVLKRMDAEGRKCRALMS